MFAVDDGIAQGNFNVADILFLIAAILFFLEVVIRATKQPNDPSRGTLIALGLTLVAVAWLLL